MEGERDKGLSGGQQKSSRLPAKEMMGGERTGGEGRGEEGRGEKEWEGCKEDLSFSVRWCLLLQLFTVKTHRQQVPQNSGDLTQREARSGSAWKGSC